MSTQRINMAELHFHGQLDMGVRLLFVYPARGMMWMWTQTIKMAEGQPGVVMRLLSGYLLGPVPRISSKNANIYLPSVGSLGLHFQFPFLGVHRSIIVINQYFRSTLKPFSCTILILIRPGLELARKFQDSSRLDPNLKDTLHISAHTFNRVINGKKTGKKKHARGSINYLPHLQILQPTQPDHHQCLGFVGVRSIATSSSNF